MSGARAARLAWSLWAMSVMLTAAAVVFMVLNRFDLDTVVADGAYLNDALIAITFPTVGALIASRRPESTEEGVRGVENPLGIAGAEGPLTAVGLAGGVAALVAMVASVASLIRRFRRSRGQERLQLKWMAYAAAVMAVLLIAGINQPSGVVFGVAQALVIGPGLALAAGVAILKHHLYDIDLVINRTLVYGALTATLAGACLDALGGELRRVLR